MRAQSMRMRQVNQRSASTVNIFVVYYRVLTPHFFCILFDFPVDTEAKYQFTSTQVNAHRFSVLGSDMALRVTVTTESRSMYFNAASRSHSIHTAPTAEQAVSVLATSMTSVALIWWHGSSRAV